MRTINFHWPVYKNLEKEVIDLSFSVFFDDVQFEYIPTNGEGETKYFRTPPYSLKIGDLLVRCCTEVEALIQEMSRDCDDEIKKIPIFDEKKGITINNRALYLNDLWNLDKKVIYVSAPSMFFQKEDNLAFAPFCYRKEDNDDFISAYNVIKHNRNIETIYKGNIRFLLRAMAALYLLNIYYKDETIDLGRFYNTKNRFDNRLGSDLFSVKYFNAQSMSWNNDITDENILWPKGNSRQESTYIIKFTDRSYKSIHKAYCHDNDITYQRIENSQQIKDFLKNNPDKKFKNINALLMEIGGIELVRQIVSCEYGQILINAESQAILNKNQAIYPCVSKEANL